MKYANTNRESAGGSSESTHGRLTRMGRKKKGRDSRSRKGAGYSDGPEVGVLAKWLILIIGWLAITIIFAPLIQSNDFFDFFFTLGGLFTYFDTITSVAIILLFIGVIDVVQNG